MPDPFFETVHDGKWNACVGQQGHELNYVDGYIEAAQLLAEAIVEGSRYDQRDTLILPILYNARHAVELVLKFAINHLHRMDALAAAHPANHDIESHWKHLSDAKVGDLAMRNHVAALAPYVGSLASIDEDGQELRYATTRNGVVSLANQATVNIRHVRDNLKGLRTAITDLVDRVSAFSAERVTKTYTRECSRKDLKEIAGVMGPRPGWNNADYVSRRAEVCARFGLSNGKFSDAINAILGSRELAAIVGVETDLRYISDDKAVATMTAWAAWAAGERRAPRMRSGRGGFEQFMAGGQSTDNLDAKVAELLNVEELADLAALYELGMLRGFGERYQDILSEALARFRSYKDLDNAIVYLMHKTTLLDCVIKGASIAGKPSLSVKLATVRVSVA